MSVGQEVTVKILKIDQEHKRIALSMTKADADKERNEFQQYQAESRLNEKSNNVTLGDKFADLFAKLKE